jgi:hypothetical protein
MNNFLVIIRNFLLSDVTTSTDSVGIFRGMIALLSLAVLAVMLRISLSLYGRLEFRFAAILIRIGLVFIAFSYWVLILGAAPLIGSTTTHLTWVLTILYFGQIFLLIGVGLLSKARAFKLTDSRPSETNWNPSLPDRRSST